MKKLLAMLLSLMMLATSAFAMAESTDAFSLNVCLASEPETIDPQLNTSVDGAIMLQHAFEGLYKWIDDGEGNATLTLGAAEAVEVSEDGLVYTYTMRDGAQWSDGQPVTANDFVYTWQRLVNPDTAADYNYMIEMVQNAGEIMAGEMEPSELGIKAIDDNTLEITLHTLCPYFDEICAFPATFPVRQDIIEASGDQWTFDTATYIGNGPYKVTEWVHNGHILMEKSETYYDVDKLGPASIKFNLMDDDNAILAGYENGDLNFIESVPVDEIPRLTDEGKLKIVDYIGTYYACFNNQRAPFDDPNVRKAFNLVIDRDYIIDQITQTGEVPASAYVPSGIYDAAGPGSDDFRTVGGEYWSVEEADYDAKCEEARQLLADAGYPNGEGFPVVEYLYNTNERHRVIGEALQNMWQTQLGVTVTLGNQDWAVFLQTRKDHNYDISRNGWIADYNDPMCFLDMWVTGGGNNDADYQNEEYDALIAEAKKTADPDVRMQLMHQAEDIMIGQDSALAPIYFYKNYYLDQGFEGLYYTPLGYFFFGYTSLAE